MGASIVKTSYYLPEQLLSNDDLSNLFENFDAEKTASKIGIQTRHISAKGETALNMAECAANEVLNNSLRNEVDFVLFCTQSPEYILPTSACILQDRLGLKKNIGAFDFNLGCSGYVYGLSIAKGLIAGNIAKCVLLVVAETYSKHLHPMDKANRAIFGDGAAASVIKYCDSDQIGEFILGTDGSGFDKLIIRNGGMNKSYTDNCVDYEYGSGNITNDNCLYMDGPEIFNFTIENVPSVVEQTLIKNNKTIEDIDMFIYHQANKFMLNHLRKMSNIPKEKFYIGLENSGNTVSATIPIALTDCLNKGLIKSGSNVLLIGFGVGLSLGATIVSIP